MGISSRMGQWFTNYNSLSSPGAKLRSKRIAPLLRLIETKYKEHGSVSIIDLGGTEQYWDIVPIEVLNNNKVQITIVNLPGTQVQSDHGPFNFVQADACNLSDFPDKSFDIVHSNSVIEHVGDWDRMVSFAAEVKRLSVNYFVQTPNYWFPIEPHCMTPFYHWLPKPFRLFLVTHFQLGHWEQANSIDEGMQLVESARLLDRKMFQSLFNEATITTEKYFLLPKSFIAT